MLNRFPVLLLAKQKANKCVYTYGEMSKATGLSRAVLWRWNTDKVVHSYDTRAIEALCKWLNCPIESLLVLGDRPIP